MTSDAAKKLAGRLLERVKPALEGEGLFVHVPDKALVQFSKEGEPFVEAVIELGPPR